jgi:hypothetical protein
VKLQSGPAPPLSNLAAMVAHVKTHHILGGQSLLQALEGLDLPAGPEATVSDQVRGCWLHASIISCRCWTLDPVRPAGQAPPRHCHCSVVAAHAGLAAIHCSHFVLPAIDHSNSI